MRLCLFLALACGWVSPALADDTPPPLDFSANYTADVSATLSGGLDNRVRYLDDIDLIAEADLDQLVGWQGGHAHVYALGNFGKRPNDAAGTLQGVDNIEVGKSGVRLFEAWVSQDIGSTNLLAGLYDLNSEFYANDAAGLLIAPAFGIGSELAATGPNGPSIFPSSALALRLSHTFNDGKFKVQAAVVNARASTFGDERGVDFTFDDGVLAIAELSAGSAEELRAMAGVWTYSKDREDIFATDSAGNPLRRPAWGAYGGLEARLASDGEKNLSGFARAGFTSGGSTPYAWGGQAGLLLSPVWTARENSSASIGLQYARTDRSFREASRASGVMPSGSEYGVEATYADNVLPGVTIQPDLQWIVHPGGEAGRKPAFVATLRMGVDLLALIRR